MSEKKHTHTMAVKYEPDFPSNDRPSWAESYKGPRRWLIIDYCTDCEYSRARGITYEKPVPAPKPQKDKV